MDRSRSKSNILIEKRNVAGNLKRIEQTAKAQLEELVDLGDRFNDAYDRYFQALAPAVQKHLILATYQICTRGYPEHFLALSVAERASAQSQLQQLAKQIRLGFEEYFESDDPEWSESESGESELEEPGRDRDGDGTDAERPGFNADIEPGEGSVNRDLDRSLGRDQEAEDVDRAQPAENGSPDSSRSPSAPESVPESAPGDADRQSRKIDLSSLANISTWRIEDLTSANLKRSMGDHRHRGEDDLAAPSSAPGSETFLPDNNAAASDRPGNPDNAAQAQARPNLSEREAQLIALALEAKLRAELEDDDDDDDITTPNNLRAWQRSVESDIVRMLHQASAQANQLLHQCGILPQEFPLGLLEAFGQGEAIAEMPTGTPNLLKLTIQTGSRDSEESASSALQLVAIHLHLAEIEFAETAVSQARHAIRQLLAELSGLRKRYAVNQKEYTIAKAEAAWRSTWSKE